jgi:FlgN protein
MNLEINELAALLEEETAIGDQLRLNLAAQRDALARWDMDALNAIIEARESWIRSLGELEARRARMVKINSGSGHLSTLRELIMACSADQPARRRLESVRARARETFLRLQADERDLNGLMATLVSHFQAALKPLASPSPAVYGESGAAASAPPSSALINNKA